MRLIPWLRKTLAHPIAFPALLLLVAVLAYGLLIPFLGFYWDDYVLTWIRQQLGPEGITRYFSTNRPLLAPLYHLTTALLGASPWKWQVFVLVWRWAGAAMLWLLLRRVWPKAPQAAEWVSLLFLVYPGFRQQHVAMIYGHFFLVQTGLFLSFYLSVSALFAPRRRAMWLTGLGLLLAAYNLLALEYWFMLELTRPLFVWAALGQDGRLSARQRLARALRAWSPYLLVFMLAAAYRAFFFNAQTTNYDFSLGEQLRADPLRAILTLLGGIARDLWTAAGAVWLRLFTPDLAGLGGRLALLFAALAVVTLLLVLAYSLLAPGKEDKKTAAWFWARRDEPPPSLPARGEEQERSHEGGEEQKRPPEGAEEQKRPPAGGGIKGGGLSEKTSPTEATEKNHSIKPSVGRSISSDWRWQALGMGLAALLLSGWSLWLTGLFPALRFPSDRFTLPFILGAALLLAGLVALIPGRAWLRAGLVALLVGLSVGAHFQNANVFRRDWVTQQRFFWQLAWRAPALQPGTIVVTDVLPVERYSDNSLTSQLNWVYDPDNHSQQMHYALFWLEVRLGGNRLPALEPGIAVRWDYLAATFTGSTSQLLPVVFNPPACLRVLDPLNDPNYEPFSPELQAAAKIGNPGVILPEGNARPAARLYPSEPAHDWCYYYEKADLARQFGRWDEVAALGDAGYALDDRANDLMEHLPFIEGYARTGSWERALALSSRAYSGTPAMADRLCGLWARIDSDTPASAEKDAALAAIRAELTCKLP